MIFRQEIYDALNEGVCREERRVADGASWYPSSAARVYPLVVQSHFVEPRLRAFRTLLVQGVQLNWPDTPSPGSPWYSTSPVRQIVSGARELRFRRRQWRDMLAVRSQPWPGFREDLVGEPYHSRRFLVAGTPDTEANLRNNFYYGLLRAHIPDLDRVASILEIGGGYGGLASCIAARHPSVRLTMLELPLACLLAGYCLGARCGGELDLGHVPGAAAARVRVVPPWAIDALESADLVVNTKSFQHMDGRNLEYYFGYLRRRRVPRVFSINRETPLHPGEVPYLDIAGRHGYTVATRDRLSPWSSEHFAHVLTLSDR